MQTLAQPKMHDRQVTPLAGDRRDFAAFPCTLAEPGNRNPGGLRFPYAALARSGCGEAAATQG